MVGVASKHPGVLPSKLHCRFKLGASEKVEPRSISKCKRSLASRSFCIFKFGVVIVNKRRSSTIYYHVGYSGSGRITVVGYSGIDSDTAGDVFRDREICRRFTS